MRELPKEIPETVAGNILERGLDPRPHGRAAAGAAPFSSPGIEFVEAVPKRGPHIARKGWRYWFWTPFGLMSGFAGKREDPWPVGAPARAVCIRAGGGYGAHEVPNERHGCGLRAVPGPYALGRWRLPKRPRTVAGEVVLWGKVLERGKVLRGEFGYPMSLYLVAPTFHDKLEIEIAKNSLAAYGVAVGEVESLDDLKREQVGTANGGGVEPTGQS